MRRVISLWLPRFSTERIGRSRGSSPSALKPLATVAADRGQLIVAAVSPAAECRGVAPGQTLADARAAIPGLEIADHDEAADLHLLARLAYWCARFSPLVALDGDGLLLDITGVPHLFGGEEAMLENLTGRIRRFGFTVRAGLADTPGAAWACARYGRDGFALKSVSTERGRWCRRTSRTGSAMSPSETIPVASG